MKREVQPFSEVVRLSQLLLRAIQANAQEAREPFTVFYGGAWKDCGVPCEWFGVEDWQSLPYCDKLRVIQCELLKRLRKYYRFTDVPDELKI